MAKLKTENQDSVFLMPGDEIGKHESLQVNLLLAIFAALLLIGLTNLYSATLGSHSYFYSQLRNLLITIPALILFGWVIPIRTVYHYSYYAFAGICLMLVIVLSIGRIAGGAQRWIPLGPLSFQPSEFAKIITILVTARFFAMNRMHTAYRLRDLLPLIGMIGIIFALIFMQPDFGTAGICVIIAASQIFFIRLDWRSLAAVAISTPIIGVFVWNVLLRDYQKLRVLNLFNPKLDPSGSGYNSFQSLIAIGSGNLFGKGYMQGTQAHLKFLPERHTDFVFSVFAEEQGFVGALAVFTLFTAISYIALDIARHTRDTFSGLVAVGIAAFVFFEFAINAAMVMGIFPVVGVPLPFFSHGSSLMLTMCVALGLLIGIYRTSQQRLKG